MKIVVAHPSCVEAASQLADYCLNKLSGSVALGEKNGQPILFNTFKAADVAPVRLVKPERFAQLGFAKGMESALWDAYRERHTRQSYLIGEDEQDYSRELILRGNFYGLDEAVRVGDFSSLDGPLDVEEDFFTHSWGFKNEALESDDDIIKTFAGAQEKHMEKVRKNIARAAREEKASRVKGKKARMVGSICASKVHRMDFDTSEAQNSIRAELDLVYRKSGIAELAPGQQPEDWLDDLYQQVEGLKEGAWKRYQQAQRLHDSNSKALKGAQTPAMQHSIKGMLLEATFDATRARADAMRYDSILGVIEREMSNICEGGLEDQTHEYGALLKDTLDHFEHQFATREGGITEIDDRASVWTEPKPSQEGVVIMQQLGYDDFADSL